jgi:hypothetical protein
MKQRKYKSTGMKNVFIIQLLLRALAILTILMDTIREDGRNM